jgi:hypothetical protein
MQVAPASGHGHPVRVISIDDTALVAGFAPTEKYVVYTEVLPCPFIGL